MHDEEALRILLRVAVDELKASVPSNPETYSGWSKLVEQMEIASQPDGDATYACGTVLYEILSESRCEHYRNLFYGED